MSSTTSTTNRTAAKPLRKDSARNRALLVAAARAVFAERGLDATLDDVARAAGVGVGTAYRHFDNKQELAREVMAQSSQLLVDDALAALHIADPWEALVGFFEASSARLVQDRGLHQALFGPTPHEKSPLRQDLVDAVVELFARAKAAGMLRPGIEATDAVPVYAMMCVAYDVSRVIDPELWRRYLVLFLDGLRATDRGPLPGRPVPIERVDEALAATKLSKR